MHYILHYHVSSLSFLEHMEDGSARHTARFYAATDAIPPELLQASTVEVKHSEERREEPDVQERDGSELAAPLSGYADATQGGVDDIT